MNDPREVCLVCAAATTASPGAVACPKCGFTLHPGAGGTFDVEAAPALADYPAWGNELLRRVEDASFWYRHRNRAILAVLGRFPFRGRLWDVGGGNGYQALALQAAGLRVAMVEPSPVGCAHAGERGVTAVIRATLASLALPAASIGGVSLFDVIEHLEQPRALLAECHRVLEPGGRVYVTVPALPGLWSHEDVIAEHKRRYTRATLAAEMDAAGFAVDFVSYYFRWLVAPIFLLRTLPWRLGARAVDPGATTTDCGNHRLPPIAAPVLEALMRREIRALARGGALGWGASLIAVASRRGTR